MKSLRDPKLKQLEVVNNILIYYQDNSCPDALEKLFKNINHHSLDYFEKIIKWSHEVQLPLTTLGNEMAIDDEPNFSLMGKIFFALNLAYRVEMSEEEIISKIELARIKVMSNGPIEWTDFPYLYGLIMEVGSIRELITDILDTLSMPNYQVVEIKIILN